MISSQSGVTIKAAPKKAVRNLADLIGTLKVDGPAISIDDLCKPVERTDEEHRDSEA